MFVGYLVALVLVFVLIINLSIVAQTKENIYELDEAAHSPNDYECILILGAGVRSDGSATPMLRDRLITGFEVFIDSPTVPIILSGDSEHSSYTETVTMKNYLINMGVPENQIICDGYGLSTYESIWRTKYVYGYDKILIISQEYHLYRAIYIADKFGMTAYGVDAALTTYGKQPIYSIREYFARIKDMIYADIHPDPKYTEIWEEKHE